MNEKGIGKKNNRYLLLVGALVVAFSLSNVLNSALVGDFEPNRNIVYVFIASILVFELLYIILKGRIYYSRFKSLTLIFAIYIFFVNLFNNIAIWNTTVHCLTLVLWLFSASFFDNIVVSEKNIKTCFFIFGVLAITFTGLSLVAQRDITSVTGKETYVLSISYYFLACVPILFLFQNKKLKSFVLIMMVVVPLFSMKRGAIVTAVLMVISYFVTYSIVQKKSISSILKVVGVVIVFVAAVLVFNKFSNGFLLERFSSSELKDGSGRSQIIQDAWQVITNRSFISLLIGTGSGSTTQNIGITTHDDFLEILFCFGIFGLLIFIGIVWFLLKEGIKKTVRRTNIAPSWMMLVAFFIGLSAFEGAYFNFAFLYVVIQFGLLSGKGIQNRYA